MLSSAQIQHLCSDRINIIHRVKKRPWAENTARGLLYGTAAMLDGLAARFATELHEPPTLIATGGMANLVMQNCVSPFIVDKHLLLDGLRLIYEKNRKKPQAPRSKQE